MARLTSAQRNKLPSSKFALPGKGEGKSGKGSGSFPIPDKGHARAALREIGNAAPADRPKIRAKANAMLGKGGGGASYGKPGTTSKGMGGGGKKR